LKKRKILRATAAAAVLGVSTKTLQRWSDAGLLRAFSRSVGGHRRFTATELERFRAAKLGEPTCPHCHRKLLGPKFRGLASYPTRVAPAEKRVAPNLAQIRSLPRATKRAGPHVVNSRGETPKKGAKAK